MNGNVCDYYRNVIYETCWVNEWQIMFLEEKNQKRDGVTYRIFQNGVIQSQKVRELAQNDIWSWLVV